MHVREGVGAGGENDDMRAPASNHDEGPDEAPPNDVLTELLTRAESDRTYASSGSKKHSSRCVVTSVREKSASSRIVSERGTGMFGKFILCEVDPIRRGGGGGEGEISAPPAARAPAKKSDQTNQSIIWRQQRNATQYILLIKVGM